MIAIDLSKQQTLDADPKAIQQIFLQQIQIEQEIQGFYFILEEAKETVFEFSQGTVKVFWMQLNVSSFIFISISDTIQQFRCKAIKFTA